MSKVTGWAVLDHGQINVQTVSTEDYRAAINGMVIICRMSFHHSIEADGIMAHWAHVAAANPWLKLVRVDICISAEEPLPPPKDTARKIDI